MAKRLVCHMLPLARKVSRFQGSPAAQQDPTSVDKLSSAGEI